MAGKRDDSTPLDARTGELLAAYRAELLRWNRQINLLSRRDPEGTADALVSQCVRAFELWWRTSGAELAAGGTLRVFDLGSGGGLPAFVWLALFKARGVAARATLVEPRAKRAWFLERLRHLPGAPAFEVVAARWGEGSVEDMAQPASVPDVAGANPILFTIKALRLSEKAVLSGLEGVSAAEAMIEIVRFQPTRGVTAERLARDLEIPAAGASFEINAVPFEAAGCRLLVPAAKGAAAAGAAGLLVSRYRRLGRPPA